MNVNFPVLSFVWGNCGRKIFDHQKFYDGSLMSINKIDTFHNILDDPALLNAFLSKNVVQKGNVPASNFGRVSSNIT